MSHDIGAWETLEISLDGMIKGSEKVVSENERTWPQFVDKLIVQHDKDIIQYEP